MNIPEWIHYVERTDFSDQVFSSIGRLLFHAHRFESYCKSVSILIELKSSSDIFDSDEKFRNFILLIEKRKLFNSVTEIERHFGKGQTIGKILHSAREARNEVAHEITLGLEHVFGNAQRELDIANKIKKLSKEIIIGEFVAITILSILTKEETPELKYVNNKIDWITNLE